jgi:hypothetical protein
MRRVDVVDRGSQQIAGRGSIEVGRKPHIDLEVAAIRDGGEALPASDAGHGQRG